MYKLFYYRRNASWAPHMLLKELGLDYELILVDRATEGQKSPEYLKLNPTGRIPTLIDGERVIVESAAICLHLAEKHPENPMLPPIADPKRTEFFQWLFYLTTSFQADLMPFFYPTRFTTVEESAPSVSDKMQERLATVLAHLDANILEKPYLLGQQISILDFYMFMLCHWASALDTKPMSYPNLAKYLSNLAQRESIKQVAEIEGTDLSMYLI